MTIEFSVKYEGCKLADKADWISIHEMPFGTLESFRRSFDHRDLTNLTVVKAESGKDGGEESCYAFEKFPNRTLGPIEGHAPETFYVTKYWTSDVYKADKAIEKYWKGEIAESGPIESRLALPLEASDVTRIHRMLSVAVAGLGLVVDPASEQQVLLNFSDNEVAVPCKTTPLAQWKRKLPRRAGEAADLAV